MSSEFEKEEKKIVRAAGGPRRYLEDLLKRSDRGDLGFDIKHMNPTSTGVQVSILFGTTEKHNGIQKAFDDAETAKRKAAADAEALTTEAIPDPDGDSQVAAHVVDPNAEVEPARDETPNPDQDTKSAEEPLAAE